MNSRQTMTLLWWVNIWGIFSESMRLNITNKYGTFVHFIYLWDHPPTVHTQISWPILCSEIAPILPMFLLILTPCNVDILDMVHFFCSPLPLLTAAEPQAADVCSGSRRQLMIPGYAAQSLIRPGLPSPGNNTPGFFVKLKITNDEFLARTEIGETGAG